MYTDGPRSAEFPKNEYSEQMTRIIVFLYVGHCPVNQSTCPIILLDFYWGRGGYT